VTRERVRQVCVRLTRRPEGSDGILAPAMDRALALIEKRLPFSADEIEAELAAEGLTKVGLPLESVAQGAELLGRPVPFSLARIDRRRLAVVPGGADVAESIGELARRSVFFYGLATLDAVQRQAAKKLGGRAGQKLVRQVLPLLDGFAWLDQPGGWFRLAPIVKHGLPKVIDKILSVAGSLSVAEMRAAMSRDRRRWKSPPPEDVLLEYCRRMQGVRVEGRRLIADPPRDWRKALAGIERTLVSVMRERGPVVERGILEDLCVAGGVNRFSFHAFVSWSPVVKQLGLSVYGLVGTKVSKRKVDTVIAARRARREPRRVLEGHGQTEDGKIWMAYKLSKAASTHAVVTVPSRWRKTLRGRYRLENAQGETVGTLSARGGRAWGMGAYLRRRGIGIGDRVMLTLDPENRTAVVLLRDER
jgi:hypothetical protein